MKWVKANCEFNRFTAAHYLVISTLNVSRVRNLSQRDLLKEVAEEKVEKEAWATSTMTASYFQSTSGSMPHQRKVHES